MAHMSGEGHLSLGAHQALGPKMAGEGHLTLGAGQATAAATALIGVSVVAEGIVQHPPTDLDRLIHDAVALGPFIIAPLADALDHLMAALEHPTSPDSVMFEWCVVLAALCVLIRKLSKPD
jgi:hypothetical protein